jgi:hypothetical protein
MAPSLIDKGATTSLPQLSLRRLSSDTRSTNNLGFMKIKTRFKN